MTVGWKMKGAVLYISITNPNKEGHVDPTHRSCG